MKKKVALTVAAAALVGTLAVGGTLAYFTDTETATNTITTGFVDVKITETDPKATDEKDGYTSRVNEDKEGITYSDVEPGVKIAKDPVITYEGTSKGYVRYKVEVTVTPADGKTFAEGVETQLKNAVKFFKNGAQVDVEVGTYYYAALSTEDNTIMGTPYKKGDEVVKLFDTVKLDSSLGNDDLKDLGNIEIKVVADAIQADNLDTDGDGKTSVDEVAAAFGEGAVDDYKDDKAVQ